MQRFDTKLGVFLLHQSTGLLFLLHFVMEQSIACFLFGYVMYRAVGGLCETTYGKKCNLRNILGNEFSFFDVRVVSCTLLVRMGCPLCFFYTKYRFCQLLLVDKSLHTRGLGHELLGQETGVLMQEMQQEWSAYLEKM